MRRSTRPATADTQPSGSELVRHRLIDRLRERWAVSVVVVEAAGGFGKTVALLQAMRANRREPLGVDVYLDCGPSDRDVTRLARRVLAELDVTPPAVFADVGALAGVIATALADRAPEQVALVFDDVQHLQGADGAPNEAVQLVGSLIRLLPTNAHIVLAGRRIPALPLARIEAADQLVQIRDDELVFTDAEGTLLAERYGTAAPDGIVTAGWPALVRLSLLSQRSAPIDFLLEEVVHSLDADLQAGLAAAIMARGADDALLHQVTDGRIDADDLAAAIPLLADLGDGRARPHELWGGVLGHLSTPVRRGAIARAAVEWLVADAKHEAAMELSLANGETERARRIVVEALELSDPGLRASTAERWHAMFEPTDTARPELRLLRGVALRLAGDIEGAKTEVEAALALLAGSDDQRTRAAATLEMGLIAWLSADLGRMLEMVGVAQGMQTLGINSVDWMVDLAHAGFADLRGAPEEAFARAERVDVDAVPTRVAQLVMRLRCVLPLLFGDTALATHHATRLEEYEDGAMARQLVQAVAWQHGDPEPMRTMVPAPPQPAELTNTLDQFSRPPTEPSWARRSVMSSTSASSDP